MLWLLCACREVSQLTLRSESHVRPQDPAPAAAEVKLTDLVAPLYTLRWAAMQNVLSDLVSMLPTASTPVLVFCLRPTRPVPPAGMSLAMEPFCTC
jgi:hypothetical protein